MRVLLVEDDDGDALIVEEELELSGAPRRRGARAARSARPPPPASQRFDCVLLDLNLPDAQGLDGLHELRELAPDLAVLVLTGLDDERRGIEAVGAGAQDYLIKGSTSGVLLARSLRYAVERRRAELTQQQLSIAQLEARENARLERGLLPAPLVTDPALTLATHYQPGPPPRAARRRLLRRRADAGGTSTPSSATSAATGPTRRRSASRCASPGARSCSPACRPDELLAAPPGRARRSSATPRQVFTTLCMVSARPGARARDRCGSPATRRRCCSRGGGVEALEPGPPGPPLGVLDDAAWPAYEVALPRRVVAAALHRRADRRPRRRRRRGGWARTGLADVVAAARRAAGERRPTSWCGSSSSAPRSSTAARSPTTPPCC